MLLTQWQRWHIKEARCRCMIIILALLLPYTRLLASIDLEPPQMHLSMPDWLLSFRNLPDSVSKANHGLWGLRPAGWKPGNHLAAHRDGEPGEQEVLQLVSTRFCHHHPAPQILSRNTKSESNLVPSQFWEMPLVKQVQELLWLGNPTAP